MTSVDFSALKWKIIHLSPHTYVDIYSANLLFDTNFHKSNSHTNFEMNYHFLKYESAWKNTISCPDVPGLAVKTALCVQMCLHKSSCQTENSVNPHFNTVIFTPVLDGPWIIFSEFLAGNNLTQSLSDCKLSLCIILCLLFHPEQL